MRTALSCDETPTAAPARSQLRPGCRRQRLIGAAAAGPAVADLVRDHHFGSFHCSGLWQPRNCAAARLTTAFGAGLVSNFPCFTGGGSFTSREATPSRDRLHRSIGSLSPLRDMSCYRRLDHRDVAGAAADRADQISLTSPRILTAPSPPCFGSLHGRRGSGMDPPPFQRRSPRTLHLLGHLRYRRRRRGTGAPGPPGLQRDHPMRRLVSMLILGSIRSLYVDGCFGTVALIFPAATPLAVRTWWLYAPR